MTVFGIFFASIAFAQLMMGSLLLTPLWKTNQSIRLYMLLMVCCCCYLTKVIFAPVAFGSFFWWLELVGGNALPGVFWLVSLSVFGDHVILKRWQYALASLTLLIPFVTTTSQMLFSYDINDFATLAATIKYGGTLLELLFIGHALLIAVSHWRGDLVQERRYIRGGVISVSALYIILVIINDEIFKFQWPGVELLKSGVMALLVTAINFFLFTLKGSSLFETVKQPQPDTCVPDASAHELPRIIDAMEQDKLYRQEGMTIAGLAKALSIHEYKLRNLINGEMNYRNFNDFLNHYRIREVTEKLAQPAFSQTPVLTLALESGFRSLSSFNKAFKNTHQLTPTEYRKKVLSSAPV
ncbi:helix-turn-helix domain-containing protein [Thalassomonas sp. RHCl1]|uniref:helix-turn-helix domain-containing protein n=1 Tax=Thalassomonas sp. RHCl1 TaxID=2995320 RepID=UPI00248BE5F2|nr:helix-turn-helix domain-containing protein [Thalassomonas sp. RHCl1]